ncbi:hypothetical protein KSD_18160 [Ktedonobacter sp. SOSP1-85]|uniref:hypothetical protein n=1 Tax=unclassified Ktedonobacter TaxID=388461 RepID=UPI001915FD38|nr:MULTISPECIES: hypothetical protein [unclassified Ktedonobacter]GHO66746.1 hypothetical protein KSC_056380 [Ktedonobacter sp. SOSP1-52]GHO74045.1 hypothetical protein KSD_18160 [Ktedonobacter sp. SOSP1-85]
MRAQSWPPTFLHLKYCLLLLLISAFLVTGCAPGNEISTNTSAPIATPTWIQTGMHSTQSSSATFHVTGARSGSYTWQSHIFTSKLRHGLKEFTIFLQDQDHSLIIAFYGYEGARTYTLEGPINGGDVRLDFGHEGGAWDLQLQAGIRCQLTIIHDEPAIQPNVNRMQGSFSCPQLSAVGTHTQEIIAIPQATFDILMIHES